MRTRCPKCAAKGRDTSGNGVKVYPDGSGYCFKCESWYRKDQLGEAKLSTSGLTIDQVATYPYGTAEHRKIPESICEVYGVRYAANGETGKPETVYYPSTNKNGDVLGYKVRDLPKKFGKSVGEIGKTVFGCQLQGQGDFLLLTEGEEDCLAAKAMLATRKVDVMAMPNGTSLSEEVQAQLVDIANNYKRVYLSYDADAPGQEAVVKTADFLATIIETRVIQLDPTVGKDASDYYVSGHETDYREAIKNAEIYEPEGIVNGTDISLHDLLAPMPEGYTIPFDGLHDKLHGVRKGEILTVCAGSGIGKSTLVREITKSLIEQDLSIANIALEDQMNVAAQALVALDMDIPLAKFRVNPPDFSDAAPHYEKMVSNGKTYFWKNFAGITSDTLMQKLYYYARTKKVDFIVLDHLSLVISASEDHNERKAIDQLMTKLAKLVVETGVGLIQIVHLKRTGGDKNFARGGEVELTDLRGSAALEQLSWSVVGLERDQQGDDRDFSKVRVLKNRTWGFTGLADSVKYDPLTGRMKSVDIPSHAPETAVTEAE